MFSRCRCDLDHSGLRRNRLMPIRVGVAGFGSIGRHHARNLAAMPGVEVAAIADPSPDARAAAKELGYAAVDSVERLAALDIDAAIVAVPTSEHEAAAIPLIEARRALLIEKPLAGSLEAAKRILARVEAAGIPLMVGYVERYNPALEAIRDFIASGSLGELLSITARRVGALPPRIRDANVLIDIGVHDIDIVTFITGARRVHLLAARGGMAVLDDRLDYATMLLDAGGCVVTIEANWVTPVKVRELAITGTRGFCHVDYITQEAWFAPGRSFAPTATYEALVAQYREGTMIQLPVARAEPLARELQAFVNGVKGDPMPDPRIALASLRLAEEATAEIMASVRRSQTA
jgi:predicted dehydrogenase